MSSIIVNPKNYTGYELDTIFFRPLLSGPSAESLGIRILYNMPMPTVVQIWDRQGNVLSPFDQATIFELITNRSDVNMEDLSGTELEAAETELFRRSIADSIRMNLWLGDKGGALNTGYTSFDGLLKIVQERVVSGAIANSMTDVSEQLTDYTITELFSKIVNEASPRLKGMYDEGQVAFFVSPSIYNRYEAYLDNSFGAAAYQDTQDGRKQLMYHGFPVIPINLEPAIGNSSLSNEFIIFTDRRNLVMAVNTADSPGSEVRMWYNPDEMENRQRAVFAIGCEILDEELVTAYINIE